MNDDILDSLAREVYHVRSQSAREMTDERWANIKVRFPGSVRVCLEEAQRILDSGDFDDYTN